MATEGKRPLSYNTKSLNFYKKASSGQDLSNISQENAYNDITNINMSIQTSMKITNGKPKIYYTPKALIKFMRSYKKKSGEGYTEIIGNPPFGIE